MCTAQAWPGATRLRPRFSFISALLQPHTPRTRPARHNRRHGPPFTASGEFFRKRVLFGFFVSVVIYPFAVYGLRRFFTERLGMESNIGILVFLLASVVSWLAAEAVGRL